MSYGERQPAFFSEESYFDSAQAVWIDPDAEKIPFGLWKLLEAASVLA